MGAASEASGAQARGMWPSAASSPEVGSKPIQPAPGRYTSAQACRSKESFEAPAGASSPGSSDASWIRYPETKRAANPRCRSILDQQPCRIAAGTGTPVEGLLATLNARLEARRHSRSHPALVDLDRLENPGWDAARVDTLSRKPCSCGPAGSKARYAFEISGERRRVLKRVVFCLRLKKIVERIDRGKLGDQVHFDH